jgi:WD40 repeat protein
VRARCPDATCLHSCRDLSGGMFLQSSLLHGGTVRCVSADRGILVSGGSDATIRCWWALPDGDAPNAACPFLLSGVQPVKLSGSSAHTGPITSLQLLEQHMYSGSWDMTVRCWQRTDRSLQPSAVWVRYPHQPGTTSPVWHAVKHVDVYLCLVSYGQTCCLSWTRYIFWWR